MPDWLKLAPPGRSVPRPGYGSGSRRPWPCGRLRPRGASLRRRAASLRRTLVLGPRRLLGDRMALSWRQPVAAFSGDLPQKTRRRRRRRRWRGCVSGSGRCTRSSRTSSSGACSSSRRCPRRLRGTRATWRTRTGTASQSSPRLVFDGGTEVVDLYRAPTGGGGQEAGTQEAGVKRLTLLTAQSIASWGRVYTSDPGEPRAP